MSIYLLQGAVEEGLIYALVALGLLISYGILGIADMTTDGTFVLGSAVSSILLIQGVSPALSLLLAVVAGATAGLVTSVLQTLLGIPSILAGIITMTALYSVNLMVQGGTPNLFFDSQATVFSKVEAIGKSYGVLLFLGVLVALLGVLFVLFFRTRIGLSIRATGDNPAMVEASSINPRFTITVGLCLSNGLVALAGALWSQRTTQGDINMGTGVVVIGLASLVLGELIFRRPSMSFRVLAAIVGAVLYRMVYTTALRYTENAGYLKIVSAVLLTVIMAYPTVKGLIQRRNKRRKEVRAYANRG